MKITITMKDPDGPPNCIADAVEREVAALNLPEDEREMIEEKRRDKLNDICRKWLRYGEYIDVEIDTEAMTATVMPARG